MLNLVKTTKTPLPLCREIFPISRTKFSEEGVGFCDMIVSVGRKNPESQRLREGATK
jgi:hypothetical protein